MRQPWNLVPHEYHFHRRLSYIDSWQYAHLSNTPLSFITTMQVVEEELQTTHETKICRKTLQFNSIISTIFAGYPTKQSHLLSMNSVVSEKIFFKVITNVQKGQQLKHGSIDFDQNLTKDRFHQAKYFYPVSEFCFTYITVLVMKKKKQNKTAVWPLCSIFGNRDHVFHI